MESIEKKERGKKKIHNLHFKKIKNKINVFGFVLFFFDIFMLNAKNYNIFNAIFRLKKYFFLGLF